MVRYNSITVKIRNARKEIERVMNLNEILFESSLEERV